MLYVPDVWLCRLVTAAPSVWTHFRRVVQAFEGFKQAVQDRRALCSTLRSVAARLRSQNVAAAFAAWGDAVELRRSQKAAAQAHHHFHVLRATCNAWAECVAVELLERERKVAGFTSRYQAAKTGSLQRRTFTAWRQTLACGGITDQQQRLMKQCMNRMHRRHIEVVFDAWRSAAEARYERMRRLLILRSKLLKASALQCWCVSSSLCTLLPIQGSPDMPNSPLRQIFSPRLQCCMQVHQCHGMWETAQAARQGCLAHAEHASAPCVCGMAAGHPRVCSCTSTSNPNLPTTTVAQPCKSHQGMARPHM